MLTALGRLHPASVARSVVAYEAHWMRRQARIGPPYRGRRTPTVLARVLSVTRAFCELRVPATSAAPVEIDDVLQLMVSRAADATERTFVKLLIGALGFFPTGTLVELITGEMAVVMGPPRLPIDFARPPVRVLYGTSGQLLEAPFDVDLAAPRAASDPLRVIRRPIDADDVQAQALRTAIAAATARRPPPLRAPLPPPTVRRAVPMEQTLAELTCPEPSASPEAPAADPPPSSRRDLTPPSRRGVPARAPTDDAPTAIRAPLISREEPDDERPRIAEVTREVKIEEIAGLLQRSAPTSKRGEPAPPPSDRGPMSERDRLLAAFLSDDALPDDPEKP